MNNPIFGKYIPTGHPQHTVKASIESVNLYLSRGWVCEPKIDGWFCQVHIDSAKKVMALTKNGFRLAKGLPPPLKEALKEQLAPEKGLTVVVGEWVASLGRLYLFDMVIDGDESLSTDSYENRFARLPKGDFPPLFVVPKITAAEEAMGILSAEDDLIEGLVFRDPNAKGFSQSSMARCRKDGHRHSHRLK
jgi:ATP-dependent DNA ligase